MADLIMYRPTPDEVGYTFGGRDPVARLRPGDTLVVDTMDCFAGAVRTVDDLPSRVCRMPWLNPVSGPFQVDGARPGDTLAVHFVEITPARDWGVSSTFPHFGALTSTHTTPTLQPPLPERVWIYDIDLPAGVVRYSARASDHRVDLPLRPMHGTVGVAPPGGQVHSTLTSDRHGGNLDVPQLRAGTTLYLGVNVPGAMLSLGDGHARQGDGEISGVAVETAMRTTITVDVIPGLPTPWPRIESDTTLMSIGCARPLDDALRISHHDLTTWVSALTGLDPLDALQLLAQAGRARVGNMVDPNYTMLAALDTAYLPGATAYAGTHRRLRTAAATTGAGTTATGTTGTVSR